MVTALQEEEISPNPNQLSCDCRQNGFKELPVKRPGRFLRLLLITNTSCTAALLSTVALNQGRQPHSPGAGRTRQEGDIHSTGEVKGPRKRPEALHMNTITIPPEEGKQNAVVIRKRLHRMPWARKRPTPSLPFSQKSERGGDEHPLRRHTPTNSPGQAFPVTRNSFLPIGSFHTTTRIPEMPFIALGGWSSSSLEAHVPSRSFMQQRLVATARDEAAGGPVPVSVALLTHGVTNGTPLPWALSFPNYITESVQILQRQ